MSSIVRRLSSALRAAGVDNPALDARLLIAHALGIERAQLLSQPDRLLTNDEMRAVEDLIARRARREPVSRILGMREFWGLPFALNEATLDPRPESETVVETAIRNQMSDARKNNSSDIRHLTSDFRILDLGTGTGCLLLALLHELPDATGLGVDCAPRAVEQARENAIRLGLGTRAEFKIGNWAEGIDEPFDLVVSNPPYIVRGEIPALMPEVREYDPARSLDGGADGLDAYRLLIPQLPSLLKPGGIAVFEIGIGQGDAVRALFEKSGFRDIETRCDLGGIERCLIAANG